MHGRKPNFPLIAFGLVCLMGAIGLSVHNNAEDSSAEEESASIVETLKKGSIEYNASQMYGEVEAIPDYQLNPEMEMPTVKVNNEKYIGIVEVPELKVSLPINSTWSYNKLKSSPCLYSGSIYTNDAIIMAHNYRSHFKPLWRAKTGMTVLIRDMDGNLFDYTVSSIKNLFPEDVLELQSLAQEYDLVLFTCTYGANERIVLGCNLSEE